LFDEVRYLAFKKASAALKCLPFPVTNIDEVSNIRDIGQHSKKVIQEILDEGISSEVKKIENSVWFKTMRLFTNVYGIGPKTAKQWYEIGLRSIEEVINSDSAIKIQHKRVIHGLAFYDDLNEPMTRLEANRILAIVRKEIKSKFSLDHMKIEIFLTGGFGRGKEVGHDLDILITHKDEGSDRGLLSQLYAHFKAMNFILLGNFDTNNDCETDEKRKNSTLDNFDKVFTIFKLPINENECDLSTPDFDARNTRALFEFAQSHRKTKWKARRVDLIVCPYSQLPFAMIGWIGNEMFNRSLREYAKKEMNMKLTNHCLRDLTKGCDLVARNELEVFELLKLPFIEHSLRNP
jgi:DNA polymerase/3'-5' exonuclease PolX